MPQSKNVIPLAELQGMHVNTFTRKPDSIFPACTLFADDSSNLILITTTQYQIRSQHHNGNITARSVEACRTFTSLIFRDDLTLLPHDHAANILPGVTTTTEIWPATNTVCEARLASKEH